MIATAHPELRLTVLDGGTVFRRSAEYFPFARVALPTLGFHGGTHQGWGAPDDVAVIRTERSARIAQYLFYVIKELADAAKRPEWTAEGRRHLAEIGEGP